MQSNQANPESGVEPIYRVRLTDPQARWAAYAIEEVSALEWDNGTKLPYLEGRTLFFTEPSEEVIYVFLDALENQLRDECYADGVEYPRSAATLAGKLRKAREEGQLP